jgi:cytochrome c oxidase cbb3-type subunit I/II
LLYTALPDWAQSLGTVFSVMLIAPSWGGMMNGLLTLRGAWDKVREDPVLKFMVVAVTCYGMATFEGPMLSLKNVNALGHYTDWIVAHVHVGALGWNGFLTFGILYWLFPKMWKTELYSKNLANVHFWVGTLGIIIYAVPMYFSGITQTLMLQEFTDEGTLKYSFQQARDAVWSMQLARSIGGTLYIIGVFIMIYNLWKTAAKGSFQSNEAAEAVPYYAKGPIDETHHPLHRKLEARPMLMLGLAFIAVAIGGIVEFVPTFLVKSNVPTISSVKPYTPLELEGRDIYIREGCYTCHSQMVRPFRHEVARFGEYSKVGEYVYDHPFQWGSKRTGPDLHRVGTRYNESWHYKHMYDPTSVSPGSKMPPYPWLYENDLDYSQIGDKIKAMRTLGVPYEDGYEKIAAQDLEAQANEISQKLKSQDKNIQANPKKEIIALIAYLQRLGTDIQKKEQVASNR